MSDPSSNPRRTTSEYNPELRDVQTSSSKCARTKLDDQRRQIAEQLEQHIPGLLAALARRARSTELAKDLIHDAILTMLRQLDAAELTHVKHVAGYVYRTSANLLRNHWARAEYRVALAPPEVLDCIPQPDLRDPTETEQTARVVHHLLESLNERDRAVLTAAYLNEEDKDKICADLGLSSRQFDRVLHRAKERMRALTTRRWRRK
jgi:RNA polymerase sigma-70 factor, ECF subfamily